MAEVTKQSQKIKVEAIDLIDLAVDKKPAEFTSAFDIAMKDRISNLVTQKKLDLSSSLFGAPEGQETPDDEQEQGELDLEQPATKTEDEEETVNEGPFPPKGQKGETAPHTKAQDDAQVGRKIKNTGKEKLAKHVEMK